MTKMTNTVCGLPILTLGGKAAPSFAFFITYKYIHKVKHARVQICSCSLLPDLKVSCTVSSGKIDTWRGTVFQNHMELPDILSAIFVQIMSDTKNLTYLKVFGKMSDI